MKTDEKIRKYLDGEMTSEELSAFEKEMENSHELKRNVEHYRSTIKNFKEMSSPDLQTNYFNNIIPEFRKSIERKKKNRFAPAYAFGSVAVIIFAIVILFFISKDDIEQQPDNNFTQSLMSEEIEQYLHDYTSDYSYLNLVGDLSDDDLLVDSLLYAELNLTANNYELQVDFSNAEINLIIENLSDEEFDGLYASIADKKF
jgi:hypothetical protein